MVCDPHGRCFAEFDPNWEGGCLREPPEVRLGNRFIWYLTQRAVTCWEINQWSGEKVGLKYEVVNDWIREGGFRGLEFFDQLERMQIVEMEILKLGFEAREIQREADEARKAFSRKDSIGEGIRRHHGP